VFDDPVIFRLLAFVLAGALALSFILTRRWRYLLWFIQIQRRPRFFLGRHEGAEQLFGVGYLRISGLARWRVIVSLWQAGIEFHFCELPLVPIEEDGNDQSNSRQRPDTAGVHAGDGGPNDEPGESVPDYTIEEASRGD
jgi:hypothetical protein